jgi:hypothetical protein
VTSLPFSCRLEEEVEEGRLNNKYDDDDNDDNDTYSYIHIYIPSPVG